jgi:hypothetical protein
MKRVMKSCGVGVINTFLSLVFYQSHLDDSNRRLKHCNAFAVLQRQITRLRTQTTFPIGKHKISLWLPDYFLKFSFSLLIPIDKSVNNKKHQARSQQESVKCQSQ